MKQRISFITLAVDDVARSRAFYVDGLGWTPMFEAAGEVVMLPAGEHLMLSLWSREGFVAEIGEPPARGVAPLTLSHNVPTEPEVDAVLTLAAAHGATVKPAQHREWGG